MSYKRVSTTKTGKKKSSKKIETVLITSPRQNKEIEVIQRMKNGEELRFQVEYGDVRTIQELEKKILSADFNKYLIGYLAFKTQPDTYFPYWQVNVRTVKKLVESGVFNLIKVNSNFWKARLKPRYKFKPIYEIQEIMKTNKEQKAKEKIGLMKFGK